ncbi:hypothetical protein ACFOWX_08940 [Sphingorhabdus arenilitoris]|uniref:Lipoprotein n=1 Tax=Sphingorhabdus arenilitoris TaxID=1490041 RepID=A0ABV8RHU1_9SPHN
MKKTLILLLPIAALAACSNEKSSTITTPDGETVTATSDGDGDSGTYKVETDKGTTTVTTGSKATSDLPYGLTIYPGGKVLSNISSSGEGGSGTMLSYASNASPADIVAHYKKFAADNGFKIEGEASVNEMMTFGAKKGEDVFQITAQPDAAGSDGKTSVMVIAGMSG